MTVFHDDDWGDFEPPPRIPRLVPVVLFALAFWLLLLALWMLISYWARTMTS